MIKDVAFEDKFNCYVNDFMYFASAVAMSITVNLPILSKITFLQVS